MYKDTENRYPTLEHLWMEISGKNKNSNFLLGTFYRSTRIWSTHLWFTGMENLLSDLSSSWNDLLLLAGDFNIDLLEPTHPMTRQYLDLLYVSNLPQHIKQATRTTRESASLFDHIISNHAKQVKYADVLPSSNISDHDAARELLETHQWILKPA